MSVFWMSEQYVYRRFAKVPSGLRRDIAIYAARNKKHIIAE